MIAKVCYDLVFRGVAGLMFYLLVSGRLHRYNCKEKRGEVLKVDKRYYYGYEMVL